MYQFSLIIKSYIQKNKGNHKHLKGIQQKTLCFLFSLLQVPLLLLLSLFTLLPVLLNEIDLTQFDDVFFSC